MESTSGMDSPTDMDLLNQRYSNCNSIPLTTFQASHRKVMSFFSSPKCRWNLPEDNTTMEPSVQSTSEEMTTNVVTESPPGECSELPDDAYDLLANLIASMGILTLVRKKQTCKLKGCIW